MEKLFLSLMVGSCKFYVFFCNCAYMETEDPIVFRN